jgi:cyclopropane-fatty-acyl-phospholipid synthase
MSKYKSAFEKLFSGTDIRVNGSNPWDIKVHNPKFFRRVLQQGFLGLGESYMEGWWDCEKPDVFLYKLFQARIEQKVPKDMAFILLVLKAKLFNRQSKSKSLESIDAHYNKGNDLYCIMLDPLMMYSCGYWENADNLTRAQENKLELICQKLKLKKGQRILDIGCGWGGFAYYAARNYQVEVVGITISAAQEKLAKQRCKGLPVEIRFQDYRDVNEEFDRIVSIGMLEHVGYKNYGIFMESVKRNLKTDGWCLLHFIGGNETVHTNDPWINKYIFPEGLIPSAAQIVKAMEGKFVMEDWHNFGLDYDTTLMAWRENFEESWDCIKTNYSEKFYRMWRFYLSSCAAAFRSKRLNLWQVVISKRENLNPYRSIREFSGKNNWQPEILQK